MTISQPYPFIITTNTNNILVQKKLREFPSTSQRLSQINTQTNVKKKLVRFILMPLSFLLTLWILLKNEAQLGEGVSPTILDPECDLSLCDFFFFFFFF